MKTFDENSVDMIFADLPYFLSNSDFTVHTGKMASVNNNGQWDVSNVLQNSEVR